jgi:hypothetical protein
VQDKRGQRLGPDGAWFNHHPFGWPEVSCGMD